MKTSYKKILLLSGDILTLYLSLFIAVIIRHTQFPNLQKISELFPLFSVVFIFSLIIFYIANLYNLNASPSSPIFIKKSIQAISISGIISLLFFYIYPSAITPKTILIIQIIIFSFLFLQWRRLFTWSLSSYIPKNKIAFIGYNNQTKNLINYLKENQNLGFETKLIISNTDNNTENIKQIQKLSDLKKTIKDNQISTLILVDNPHNSQKLNTELYNCLDLKIRIINYPNFYEEITNKIPIQSITKMWFLENLNETDKTTYNSIKRIYDTLLALLLLITTLPFWLIIAILIKLESKGPIFFSMTRCGQFNKPFKMHKFRTMREENNDKSPTLENDPRITKVGKFLRKTRIDEIPQVINILKGEMSFIGPRPEIPRLIEKLEKVVPFYRERMLIKPGITGWDQVSGEYHSPSEEDTLKKLQYDLYYIKNRSLWLDISTFLKTISTILSRQGF